MSKTYRFETRIPHILLGVPLPDSENPFLAAPFEPLKVEIKISECSTPRISAEGISKELSILLNGFYEKLSEVVSGTCVTLTITEGKTMGVAGSYAAITSVTAYALARYNGERLEPWEIVELTRYVDPFEPPYGWHHVMDALRYSASTGMPAVFRNDEEFAVIERRLVEAPPIKVHIYELDSVSKINRSIIGGDLYNALVKLSGLLTLEGAVKLREEGLTPLISSLARIQNGIIYIAFEKLPSGERCLMGPGLPGYLEEICW
jgi:hypothetical protein